MTESNTAVLDARQAVVDATRYNSRTLLYTAPVLDAAAALLADVWAAAEKHYVGPADLDVAFNCLEAVARRQRGTIPQTEWDAEELLAVLIDEFAALGVTTTFDAEKGLVVIPREPETPAWGDARGPRDLAVTVSIDDVLSGWALAVDALGTYLISIAAPCDRTGAAAVAKLAIEVNKGSRGNLFVR